MGAAKFEITRKCKICGEPFVAKTITSWYCSPRCSELCVLYYFVKTSKLKFLKKYADSCMRVKSLHRNYYNLYIYAHLI